MWSLFHPSHFGSDKVFSLILTLFCKITHLKFRTCQQLKQRIVIYITKAAFYVARDSSQRRFFKGLVLLLQLKCFSLEQFYLPEAFQFLTWEPQYWVYLIIMAELYRGKKMPLSCDSINQGGEENSQPKRSMEKNKQEGWKIKPIETLKNVHPHTSGGRVK